LLVGPTTELNPASILALNGIAVSPDADALCTALNWLMDNHETAIRMGQVGRKYVVREYAAERLVRDMNALYTGLIECTLQPRRRFEAIRRLITREKEYRVNAVR
jgi:glycosyltransferase involved in cell wall biosynthesis